MEYKKQKIIDDIDKTLKVIDTLDSDSNLDSYLDNIEKSSICSINSCEDFIFRGVKEAMAREEYKSMQEAMIAESINPKNEVRKRVSLSRIIIKYFKVALVTCVCVMLTQKLMSSEFKEMSVDFTNEVNKKADNFNDMINEEYEKQKQKQKQSTNITSKAFRNDN